MAKVAVIVDEDFEDSEYRVPVQAIEQAGHETVSIGLKKGKVVKGKKEGTPVTVDLEVLEAEAESFDALLIPGGYSPDHLRAHSEPVDFVRKFISSGKPVFCICHGAQLLISADVLEGRRLTGWKSIEQDIKNAGGEFLDREVVVDRNLVTSRNPSDLPAFCRECLNQL